MSYNDRLIFSTSCSQYFYNCNIPWQRRKFHFKYAFKNILRNTWPTYSLHCWEINSVLRNSDGHWKRAVRFLSCIHLTQIHTHTHQLPCNLTDNWGDSVASHGYFKFTRAVNALSRFINFKGTYTLKIYKKIKKCRFKLDPFWYVI